MNINKVAVAADHAGFGMKETIKDFLISQGCEVKDFGCLSEESTDYPDFAHLATAAVENGKYDFGVLVCGTGNGMNMTANKYQGVRAALCYNEQISRLSRAHNNANICSLPGRFLNEAEAILIVKTFLLTSFDGGRH